MERLVLLVLNKGNCLAEMGRYETAVEMYYQVLQWQEHLYEPSSMELLNTKFQTAKMLPMVGREADGLWMLEEVKRTLKYIVPESHPLLISVKKQIRIVSGFIELKKEQEQLKVGDKEEL